MIRTWIAIPACLFIVMSAGRPAAAESPQPSMVAQTTPAAPTTTPAPTEPQNSQAQPTPQDQQATTPSDDSVGTVSAVQGTATVKHGDSTKAAKIDDEIFKGDVLQTGKDGTLGVTFDDETTFNMTANARITVDDYLYEEGGKNNVGTFNIGRGTVAFVAAAVAKTGKMTITTPTSTLGVRGTTGVVDVPDDLNTRQVEVKLYADADGRVGHIDVNARDGSSLGVLTQAATGFTIRGGIGAGARFLAVPLRISPQLAARDRGIVRQVFAARDFGRRMAIQRREMRLPGNRRGFQNRPGMQQRPGFQNRPGQQNRPGFQNRPGGPNRPGQPGAPGRNNRPGEHNRQGMQSPMPRGPGGQPGQNNRFGGPGQPGGPGRYGQPNRFGGYPAQPGVGPSRPYRQGMPYRPGAPYPGQPRYGAPGQQGAPYRQGIPAQRYGAPARPGFHLPGLRRPSAPARRAPPKEEKRR